MVTVVFTMLRQIPTTNSHGSIPFSKKYDITKALMVMHIQEENTSYPIWATPNENKSTDTKQSKKVT